MTLSEKLSTLAERARASKELLVTEEATKNALIMPFIQALGYDVFNPVEVIPEYCADVGIKKGEKVDYAVRKGDEVIMLVEAKKAGEELSTVHSSQLYRYFSVTSARLGILTNGHQYQFFSDLEALNKMDETPFLEFSLFDLREGTVRQLERLTKTAFVLDDILDAASDLKYLTQIRRTIEVQLQEPDEEFVKYFFVRANPNGRFVQSAKEQFTRIVRQAFQELVTDKVTQRLRSALQNEDASRDKAEEATPVPEPEAPCEPVDGVVTTEEELEGFRTVRAIVCSVLSSERVSWRDGKAYFSVLADNNNRKPICRLRFNGRQKYLGLIGDDKKETRHPLETVADLYRFAEALRNAARRYTETTARAGDGAERPLEADDSGTHALTPLKVVS